MCTECQDYKDEIRPWFFLQALEGLVPGASDRWVTLSANTQDPPHTRPRQPSCQVGHHSSTHRFGCNRAKKGQEKDQQYCGWRMNCCLTNGGIFFFLMKEATTGVGDRQGGLACCSPWGRKSQTRLSDRTELNWKKHQNNKQHKLQNKTQTENNYPKFQHKNKQSNNIKTNGTYNPGLGPPRGGTRRCLVCWGWGILAGSPEGNGNPLQYSCLENSMDRGAWRATVSAVTESRTQQHTCLPSHQGFPSASDSKESTSNVGDTGLIPGSGRSPGGGNGNPLQCSCLGNPMDRGARRITVHGIAKSRTQLRD